MLILLIGTFIVLVLVLKELLKLIVLVLLLTLNSMKEAGIDIVIVKHG
jgi:hypothetical protein